nr:MAG TPA: hypothetical protein [Caudoviricetes sp.]
MCHIDTPFFFDLFFTFAIIYLSTLQCRNLNESEVNNIYE